MGNIPDLIFWNNTLTQWITAAAFIAGGFIAGKLCSLIMGAILKHICHKTKSHIDDIIITVAAPPLTIMIFLGGIALALRILTLNDAIDLWTGRLLGVAFIVVIAGGLSKLVDALIVQVVPQQITLYKEAEIQPILRKVFKALVWIIAAAFILKTLGYDISAILAGLGLGGAAIALASRDTLANFFGSITVFVDRPFRFNDRIKIAGYDGYITEMGLRTSRLRTLENRTVIIPNSIFAATPIENVSLEPNTKVSQTINIKRDNGAEKIGRGIGILKEIGATLEGTGGAPAVGLITIGGAVCQVSFIYYVAKNADYLETVNRVNLEVLRRFEEAEITLA